MRKLCLVTTTPFIANALLRPHLLALASRYELTLALNMNDGYALDPRIAAAVQVLHVPIQRRITPLRDLVALRSLIRVLVAGRFDAVHSVAPKAGLLAMMAGVAAHVPVRIHTFQGEVWASRQGLARSILKAIDRVVGRLATHVLVVSRGEQAFLEGQGILLPGRSTVLGAGSIAGVDIDRFRPDDDARNSVRGELGGGDADLLVMYVGRIAEDKGVLDLARAFAAFLAGHPKSRLVFVGPDEGRLQGRLERESGRLHFTGYTATPERYLAAADIVCLPSYREGFGVALIEAGACGVPVVAARLYGTRDAVVEGVTGLFHEPRDVQDLERCLGTLADDPELRRRMGRAGRGRVAAQFRQETLVQALLDYYSRL